jgi:DNA-binding GntR family transcriptional regulator
LFHCAHNAQRVSQVGAQQTRKRKAAEPPRRKTRSSSLQVELARQILRRLDAEGTTVGTRVPEQTLARSLGVSRSPVRAALTLLVERGLLRSESGRGFILARPIDSQTLEHLIPPSEEERLYSALIADRANNSIAQEVSETEMMPRYHASRGLVRKVFMRLAAEGLASRQRGHGWRFADSLDSEEGVVESYRFRMTVECGALQEPGYRLDPARIAKLRAAHEALLAKGRRKIDGAEWFAINADFHETVASGSHNRFFVQAVRQQNNLRRMQEFGGFTSLSDERVAQSCREHLAILEALERGDQPWAAALLMRHLQLAVRYIDEVSEAPAPAAKRA